METFAFGILLVIIASTGSLAQNDDLPLSFNETDAQPIVNSDALNLLFKMATGFVNAVFNKFTQEKDYVLRLLILDQYDLQLLWKTFEGPSSLETGYIVCLVFGGLFIIFVPLVASIVCCFRCCGKCGGRLLQGEKRSRSCYRHCLCVTMLIMTILMAIPTVLVFLTNEWLRDIVKTAPERTLAASSDMSRYIDHVRDQVSDTLSSSKVDGDLPSLLQSFDVPMLIDDSSQDSLMSLNDSIYLKRETVDMTDSTDRLLASLQIQITALESNLTTLKNETMTNLDNPTCRGDSACLDVINRNRELNTEFSTEEISNLRNDLASINASLNNFDFQKFYSDLQNEIGSIPGRVRSQTQTGSESILTAITNLQTDFEKMIRPIESTKDIFMVACTVVSNRVQLFDDHFEHYTYIGGIILGSILAVIVVLYVIAMVLGVCGSNRDTDPGDRGCTSNSGGIMLMVGVGLSFIFSWLLMILVVVLFTVGGHGERYGCQPLQGPNYEGVDIVLKIDFTEFGGGNNLTNILRLCADNASLYDTFAMEKYFNSAAKSSDVMTQLRDLKIKSDSALNLINLSSVSVYPDETKTELFALKASIVDLNSHISLLGERRNDFTATDLKNYEELLVKSTSSLTTAASLQETISKYADQVREIQSSQMAPLLAEYDITVERLGELGDLAYEVNDTIDILDDTLGGLKATVEAYAEDANAEIRRKAEKSYTEIAGIAMAVSQRVVTDLRNKLGGCKPLHTAYMKLIVPVCDDFMNTINGLWFSLGWAVFFLIPSAIVAMKLMKFYRKMTFLTGYTTSNGAFY